MSEKFFFNPFPQEDPNFTGVNREEVHPLIVRYVDEILGAGVGSDADCQGDLYVGDAGIAFMFLQIHLKSPELRSKYPCLDHARKYVDSAKEKVKHSSKRADERCAFLLGYRISFRMFLARNQFNILPFFVFTATPGSMRQPPLFLNSVGNLI